MLHLLLADVLGILATLAVVGPRDIVPSEIKGEQGGKDAESHHEAAHVVASASEYSRSLPVGFGLRSGALWTIWNFRLLLLLPWILIILSGIDRNDRVSTDT